MTAQIYTGADFRAKSLRNLSIDDSSRTGETADAPTLKSNGVSGEACEFAGMIGPASSCANPVAGSSPASGTILPYCDIRTLQEAWRQSAKHAERLAVLADRAAAPGLRNHLAALAEAAADEALLIRDMADSALRRAGRTA